MVVEIVENSPIVIEVGEGGVPGKTGSLGPTGPSGPSGADSTVSGPSGPSGPSGKDSTVSGPSTLEGLTDVEVTSHENNDLIQYDSGSSKWKNKKTLSYDIDYKTYLIIEK